MLVTLLIPFTTATIDWNTDVVTYNYLASDTSDLSGNSNDLTNVGATYNLTEQAYYFDGADDYMKYSTDLLGSIGSWTINVWFKIETSPSTQFLFGSYKDANNYYNLYFSNIDTTTERIAIGNYNAGSWDYLAHTGSDDGANFFSDNNWHQLTITYSGISTGRIYLDGTDETNYQGSDAIANTLKEIWLGSDAKGGYYKGYIGTVSIYNKVLSPAEITDLYSQGRNYNPYESDNMQIIVINSTGNTINNVWAYVNGINYTNSTGNTITTDLLTNDTSTYSLQVGSNNYFTLTTNIIPADGHYQATLLKYPSISVKDEWDSTVLDDYTISINGTNYVAGVGEYSLYVPYNGTYETMITKNNYLTKTTNITYTPDSSIETTIFQNNITINLINEFTNEPVNGTVFINGVEGPEFHLKSGTYTAEATAVGFFPKNHTFNVTTLEERTINITMHDVELTIIPRDIINNNTISGANITLISLNNFSYSRTFTGVENATFNITTGDYSVIIDAPGRNHYENNISISSTGSINSYQYLYSFNSVWVYAYKQSDSSSIINFNVTIYNDNNSYSNVSSGGVARFSNILSGTYTVRVVSTGYQSADYTITVTDNSFQTVNAYLSAATDTVIFTIIDEDTSKVVEDAVVQQKKYINNKLITVASKTSDISGKVQFNYENGEDYTFVVSKNGYETKTFSLIILFSDYDVIITPENNINPSVFTDDINTYINDYFFMNDNNSWVVVSFSSPSGQLENYKVEVLNINDNLLFSGNGSNSQGEDLNVSGSYSGESYVIIKYCYTSSVNLGEKCLSRSFPAGSNPSNSFLNDDSLGSLGLLEKYFLGSIIVLIIGGVFGLAGLLAGNSLTIGVVGLLIGVGLAGLLGFFSWTTVTIVLFPLMIIIFGLLSSSWGGIN